MYYLAVVRIHTPQANITKPFYSDGTLSLEAFKKRVNEKMAPLILPSTKKSPYEINVYNFGTLNEVKGFLLLFFFNYDLMHTQEIPAPKVASTQGILPETALEFKINWD